MIHNEIDETANVAAEKKPDLNGQTGSAPLSKPAENDDDRSPPGKGIMVCVTGQRSCERLIFRGAEHKQPNDRLYIVHCVQTGHNFMNSTNEADAIEYLFTASRLVGAEMTVLREDDVMNALVNFANEHAIELIVLGSSPASEGESFAARFGYRLPNTEFDVVGTRD